MSWRDYLAANPAAGVAWSAAALLVLAALLRAWAAGRGAPFYDSLSWQGLAAAHRRPDLDLLTTAWHGHAMPAGWLLAWLLARAAPLQTWPVAVSAGALVGGYGWLLLLVLRRLFGSRPEILPLLVLGVLSTFTLPAGLWWGAQLAQLPVLVAGTASLWAHLGWLRWRRWRHLALVVLAVVAGLAFSERALLVPPLLVLLTVGWFSGPGGPLTTVWRALRLHLWEWLALAVVCGGYLWWYLTHVSAPTWDGRTASGLASAYSDAVTGAVAPALLGGPWTALPLERAVGAYLAPWLRVLAGAALAALVLGSCLLRRHAVRAWALLAIAVAAGTLSAATTGEAVSGGISGSQLLELTELALVLPLAVGLATLPLRWPVARAETLELEPVAPPGRNRDLPLRVALPLCGLLVLSSAVMLVRATGDWHRNPARQYVDTARAALAQEPRAHVVDGPVPLDAATADFRHPALLSQVFRPVVPPGRFLTHGAAGEELRVLDEHGHLRPVELVGPSAGLGPLPGCGWLVKGQAVTIPLQSGTYPGTWLARLGYYTQDDSDSTVRAGDTAAAVRFQPGVHELYVVVHGAIGLVTVDAPSSADGVCVTDVAVGVAQAAP